MLTIAAFIGGFLSGVCVQMFFRPLPDWRLRQISRNIKMSVDGLAGEARSRALVLKTQAQAEAVSELQKIASKLGVKIQVIT